MAADIIFSLDMAAKDENHHHVIRREKGSKLNHIKVNYLEGKFLRLFTLWSQPLFHVRKKTPGLLRISYPSTELM